MFGLSGPPVKPIKAVEFIIDGGGAAITAGVKGDFDWPFTGRIERVRLLADQSGSITVDLWKVAYASFPATVTNTIIVSGTKPFLSSSTSYEDAILSGWNRDFQAGETVRVNADATPATVTRVTVSIWVSQR